MPKINKLEKKPRNTERKDTDMRELRRKAYNNTAWRKMRDTYMKEHPICEKCLEKGKITPAVDIHHKRSPFQGGEVNYALLLDYDNLMALCKDCHGEIHAAQQGHITPEKILEELDALFNDNIPDSAFDNDNQ